MPKMPIWTYLAYRFFLKNRNPKGESRLAAAVGTGGQPMFVGRKDIVTRIL
jgi:hypothetical protein